MRTFPSDLDAYEAAFDDEPPLADKLAAIDALAEPAPPPVFNRRVFWSTVVVTIVLGYAAFAVWVWSW